MIKALDAISPGTRRLSEHMAGALKRKLPPAVVEKTKLHILDTFGAIVSGARLEPGVLAIRYVKGLGGKAEAGVVGSRLKATAQDAAFAGGCAAHADETDDTHPSSHIHPGAPIVPAALAAAEKVHASGRALLRAVTLGYDVGTRSTKALDVPGFMETERSIHSFGGTFGAEIGRAHV